MIVEWGALGVIVTIITALGIGFIAWGRIGAKMDGVVEAQKALAEAQKALAANSVNGDRLDAALMRMQLDINKSIETRIKEALGKSRE